MLRTLSERTLLDRLEQRLHNSLKCSTHSGGSIWFSYRRLDSIQVQNLGKLHTGRPREISMKSFSETRTLRCIELPNPDNYLRYLVCSPQYLLLSP